ncbi:hypothetical protein [Haloferula sp. A504]|uniref:hypothetical protein n=1 Tax=Haloferula sp. A504 TaxID=3373601 RepID=UPI0031C753D9|nr:hypothetical protein [Verrucomicrobiaceae bacterium E54]
MEALQNNVVQTLCAMECAKVVGGSFLMSVITSLMKVSGHEEALRLIHEIEEEVRDL